VAPEIAPPVWSVIAPRMRPALPWANEDRDTSKRPALKVVAWIALFKRHEDENFIGTPPFNARSVTSRISSNIKNHFATPLPRPNARCGYPVKIRYGPNLALRISPYGNPCQAESPALSGRLPTICYSRSLLIGTLFNFACASAVSPSSAFIPLRAGLAQALAAKKRSHQLRARLPDQDAT